MKSALSMALALAITARGATTSDIIYVTEYYDDCSTLPTKTVIDTVIHSYYPGPNGNNGPYTPHTGALTTYTTVYDQICSTGFEPKTFTITEPCTETGQARGPTHLPQGFVETTVTCHVCAETPVVTPITSPVPVPQAPGAPAPTPPAGGYPGGSPPGGPGGSAPTPPAGGYPGGFPPGGSPPGGPGGSAPPPGGASPPPTGLPPTNGGSYPPPAPGAGGSGNPPANGGAGGSSPGGAGGAGGNSPPPAGGAGSNPSPTNPARYGGGSGSGGGNPVESSSIVPFTGLASHLSSSSVGISFLVGLFSALMGVVVFAL